MDNVKEIVGFIGVAALIGVILLFAASMSPWLAVAGIIYLFK